MKVKEQLVWICEGQEELGRGVHACVISCFSRVRLCTALWTVSHQAPLSMGFSRQEYWSGLSCPPPGDLPNPGIEPTSLKSPALAVRFFTTSSTWERFSACESLRLKSEVMVEESQQGWRADERNQRVWWPFIPLYRWKSSLRARCGAPVSPWGSGVLPRSLGWTETLPHWCFPSMLKSS